MEEWYVCVSFPWWSAVTELTVLAQELGGHLFLTPPYNTWLLTDLNFSTLPSHVYDSEFCPYAKGEMAGGEQDSGLDCLTTAAVWISWQEKVILEAPAVELVDVKWMTLDGSARLQIEAAQSLPGRVP